MTEDEIKAYAEHLIREHATDVEYLSIFEMYEEYADEDDAEISDEDAKAADAMLDKAEITITWPETSAT